MLGFRLQSGTRCQGELGVRCLARACQGLHSTACPDTTATTATPTSPMTRSAITVITFPSLRAPPRDLLSALRIMAVSCGQKPPCQIVTLAMDAFIWAKWPFHSHRMQVWQWLWILLVSASDMRSSHSGTEELCLPAACCQEAAQHRLQAQGKRPKLLHAV